MFLLLRTCTCIQYWTAETIQYMYFMYSTGQLQVRRQSRMKRKRTTTKRTRYAYQTRLVQVCSAFVARLCCVHLRVRSQTRMCDTRLNERSVCGRSRRRRAMYGTTTNHRRSTGAHDNSPGHIAGRLTQERRAALASLCT